MPRSVATTVVAAIAFAASLVLVVDAQSTVAPNLPLTPSCSFEQSYFAPEGSTTPIHTRFADISYKANVLVASCFAHDYPDYCGADDDHVPNIPVDLDVSSLYFAPKYSDQISFRLSNVFNASVIGVIYELPYDYSIYPFWQVKLKPQSPPCRTEMRVGASMRIGRFRNTGVDVSNLVHVTPSIIHVNEVVNFTFQRVVSTQLASKDFYDDVVVLRDHESCPDKAPSVRDNFAQVRYFRPSGSSRLHFDFSMHSRNTGFFVLCARFQGSDTYYETAYFRVFGGNPLYFRGLAIERGKVGVGQSFMMTFFGTDLDTQSDCAALIHGSLPCSTERGDVKAYGGSKPSCKGGEPLLQGSTEFAPMPGLMRVSWNATVTERGAYRVCYYTPTRGWEDVLHFDELTQEGKDFFNRTGGSGGGIVDPNDDPRPLTRTKSRTISIPEADETQTTIPAPSTPVPPTTMPPTAAPGYQLCNYTNATTDAVVVFSCPENNTCGDDGAFCIAPPETATSAPAPTTFVCGQNFTRCTAVNATSGLNESFCCSLVQTCGDEPGVCVNVLTSTATGTVAPTVIAPTPAPTTIPPGMILCINTASGPNNGTTYFCNETEICGGDGSCAENVTETAQTLPPPTTGVPETLPPWQQRCNLTNASSGDLYEWVCLANQTCGDVERDTCIEPSTATVLPESTTLAPTTTTAAPTTTVIPQGMKLCPAVNGSSSAFFCLEEQYCGQGGVCGNATATAVPTTAPTTAAPPTAPPGKILCNGSQPGTYYYCDNETQLCSSDPNEDACDDIPASSGAPVVTEPVTIITTTAAPPITAGPGERLCTDANTSQVFICLEEQACGAYGECLTVTETAAPTPAPPTTSAPTPVPTPAGTPCTNPATNITVYCADPDRCDATTGACLAPVVTVTAVPTDAPTTAAPTPAPPAPAGMISCNETDATTGAVIGVFYCDDGETCGDNRTCIVTVTQTGAATPDVTMTAAPPATAPPGMRTCNATADGSVVFFCPNTQDCGTNTCILIQTATETVTAAPPSETQIVVPTGMKLCPGGFVCPLDTICGNARCILNVTETETATVLPTPAPTTADPDRVACTAAEGGTVAFFCPAAAPVCCVAMQACCGANHTCGDNVCVPPTTAAPPTTTAAPTSPPTTLPPVPPMTTSNAPDTTTAAPAPTAPPGFAGFSPSADPVLRLELDGRTLPSDLTARLGEVIGVPEDALVLENFTVGATGNAEVVVRIDCGPTECDNVERMNYALYLYGSSPSDFEAAGIAGMQKEESGASTITVASAEDDDKAAPVNSTSLTLIIAGTIIILALIVAFVVLYKRRQRRRDDYASTHRRFDMDAEDYERADGRQNAGNRPERAAEMGDVEAIGDGGSSAGHMHPVQAMPPIVQGDELILDMDERRPNDDPDASFGSDAPLEVDDVEVVVVPQKPGSL